MGKVGIHNFDYSLILEIYLYSSDKRLPGSCRKFTRADQDARQPEPHKHGRYKTIWRGMFEECGQLAPGRFGGT